MMFERRGLTVEEGEGDCELGESELGIVGKVTKTNGGGDSHCHVCEIV